ncbi:hypothetical protein AB0J01_28455 [Streptomyces sp. NPDC050204]|uniref:hypothetical protein n=1 Tax=Streptomyces sp. NPDC050204 TaxID=3155514 RepID=UPI003420C65B
MGAEGFTAYQNGTEAEQAFQEAVENAEHEHGHGGYTGTLAEKNSYTVITKTPMPMDEAEEYATKLLNADDPRISDKWGPAGAIPVLTDRREVEVIITTADAPAGGFRSREAAATAVLTARGELEEGEKPVYGITGVYETHPRTGRLCAGTLRVPLEGGPLQHRGWLFFGYASC